MLALLELRTLSRNKNKSDIEVVLRNNLNIILKCRKL